MLARQGNELAERVDFGTVIEDKILTDITGNYNSKDGSIC